MHRLPVRRLALVAALLPPLWTALLVGFWGVDLPHWDQIELVPLLEEMHEGRLDPQDLWRPHNEHRLLVPRALMLGLASLSGWNIRLELAVHLLLAAGIFGLAVLLLRGEARRFDVELPAWTWPVVSLLVFSPGQWENWSWGWQSQIFLAVLSTLGAVVLLARTDGTLGALGAAVCATFATWSFAVGLLVWVAVAPLTLRARDRKNALTRLALWCVAGVLVVAVTLRGLGESSRPALDELLAGGVADGMPRLLKLLGGYVSIYLGTPLLGPPIVALYGGFALLVAVVVLLWMRRPRTLRPDDPSWRRLLPWSTLLGFAAGCATLTSLGRVQHGLHQAASSRYVTIAGLFWLGALGVWLIGRQRHASERPEPRPSWLPALIVVVLVAGLTIQGLRGSRAMAAQHADRQELRVRLLRDGVETLSTDDLLRIYPDPTKTRHRLETLERLELGPWRD